MNIDHIKTAARLTPSERRLALQAGEWAAGTPHAGRVTMHKGTIADLVAMAGAYHAVMSANEEIERNPAKTARETK